jgi:hypothetical protein
MNRLNNYFKEANRHKEHILEAKDTLILPIKEYDTLSKLEKFALNTLIFRFSKLQDLMGSKIFRGFLNESGLSTDGLSFFDILRELEKEGILDIDEWQLLRELRNDIAHDYPEELDEKIEKINLFIKRSDDLLRVFDKLEEKYLEIKRRRDQNH